MLNLTIVPTGFLAELERRYPKEVYEVAVDNGKELCRASKNMVKPEILQKMDIDFKMPCDDKEFVDYFSKMFSTLLDFDGGVVEVFKDKD